MVRLRVPINDGNANAGGIGAGIPTSGVQVFIPAALNRPSHTLYSITTAVQPTLQEWTVNRRYSQFLTLRQDILATLLARRPANMAACPGCTSFGLALRKFDFPRKAWLRTNRIVRKRVKSLQLFLQLIVERLFNDLPKCHVCGEQVKKMVRPFLIRGAQPMGDSTITKIQHSLSLQSYAIVKHKPRHLRVPDYPEHEYDEALDPGVQLMSNKKAPSSTHSTDSMAVTERTDSDPAMATDHPNSPSQVDFASSTISEDSYGKQFDGEERCTEARVPLEEALKQVVVLDKRKSTIEEIAFRLSSMWDAYDMEETLAAAPDLKLKLSDTQEEGSEDGMMPGENYYDYDDEVLMMEPDDENNTSIALMEDESIFDEGDDDNRTMRGKAFSVDEVTL